MSPAPRDPTERAAYLARLRREIDADEYETPERLEAAVDALAADVARCGANTAPRPGFRWN